jgi:hypothetical protein
MADTQANNAILTKILERLNELERQMREGFAVAAQERQAITKRMEEGFAAATQEQRALRNDQQNLSKRMEEGFATAAQELQAVYTKIIQQVAKEFSDTTGLLYKNIEANRKETETLRKDSQKFQNDSLIFQKAVLEMLQDIQRALEKSEQRSLIHDELLERLTRDVEELKEER